MPNQFLVRKETSTSHYEVVNLETGESWWECIFYTESWGEFATAASRILGQPISSYRKGKDEDVKSWLLRIKELKQLLAEKQVKAEISNSFYKISYKLKDKKLVRVSYAFRKPPKKESDAKSNSQTNAD